MSATTPTDTVDGVTSNNYRADIERVAPLRLEVSGRVLKAINEAAYIAQKEIDSMHPDTRSVHTFDQREIREVRQQLKSKIADAKAKASSGDDRLWTQITLTTAEITAIDEGVVETVVNDNYACPHRMQRLDHLLTDATRTS